MRSLLRYRPTGPVGDPALSLPSHPAKVALDAAQHPSQKSTPRAVSADEISADLGRRQSTRNPNGSDQSTMLSMVISSRLV